MLSDAHRNTIITWLLGAVCALVAIFALPRSLPSGYARQTTQAHSVIVFHGNSNTRGYVDNTEDRYPSRVMSHFNAMEWDGYNLGTNSRQTPMLTQEAPVRVDTFYSAKNRRNVVVVWECINHLRSGGSAEQPITADVAYQSLADYCNARRSVGWQVVIITVQNTTDYKHQGTRARFEAARNSINSRLRTHYHEYADALVDLD